MNRKIRRALLKNVKSTSTDIDFNSEEAKKFFEHNCFDGQRNIKSSLLKFHIDNIKDGLFFQSQIVIAKWKEGRGGAIKYAILDGQHRLKAIITINTSDWYRLNVLTLELKDKDEVRMFYRFFNNSRSTRNLGDLVKFQISHSENYNHDTKTTRWVKPTELVQSLPYTTGYYFTPNGFKISELSDKAETKIEYLSGLIDKSSFWEAFDFVQGNSFKNTKGIRDLLPANTRKMLGVKGYGAMMDNYIRHKIINTMMNRLRKLYSERDMKGTEDVPKFFYLLWKTFDSYRHNKKTVPTMDKLRSVTNDDVFKDCFKESVRPL